QALRDLLAEGLSSGEPVVWEKDAFLKKVKAGTRGAGENR
ncbi:type II toxin-antitoxin system ParD family antitoxin, partial [Escherichia coli]